MEGSEGMAACARPLSLAILEDLYILYISKDMQCCGGGGGGGDSGSSDKEGLVRLKQKE